jgi:NitT/TauT family transport system substrate-binding protein
MEAMFRKNGLEQRDYTLVEANFPTLPVMLQEGKIDIGPILQPWKLQLINSGDYEVLFAARDALGPVSFTFLVGRTEFLEEHREALYDFFEDHVAASRWFNDPANHAEATQIVADFMKLPVENLSYFFTTDDYFQDPWLFPNVPGIQSMADTSVDLGLAPVKLEAAKYVDTSFVEEAKRRIEAR